MDRTDEFRRVVGLYTAMQTPAVIPKDAMNLSEFYVVASQTSKILSNTCSPSNIDKIGHNLVLLSNNNNLQNPQIIQHRKYVVESLKTRFNERLLLEEKRKSEEKKNRARYSFHSRDNDDEEMFHGASVLTQRRARQTREDITRVEKKLHELGSLFVDMSAIVQKQANIVERIEDDIETGLYIAKDTKDILETTNDRENEQKRTIIKCLFLVMCFACLFMWIRKNS